MQEKTRLKWYQGFIILFSFSKECTSPRTVGVKNWEKSFSHLAGKADSQISKAAICL